MCGVCGMWREEGVIHEFVQHKTCHPSEITVFTSDAKQKTPPHKSRRWVIVQ